MCPSQFEDEWRAEFEMYGDSHAGKFIFSDPMPEEKRQFGFRWLAERERARKAREETNIWYARWTFYAAVAAVVIGILGVAVTLFH
jgi:hypothetical protein